MSLYLCVFRGDEDLEGVDVGSYEDFRRFRNTVSTSLELDVPGSRFPILQQHSETDGEWTPAECGGLEQELVQIGTELAKLPARPFSVAEKDIAEELELAPRNLAESIIDVDGASLLDRLIGLCRLAIEQHEPILFQ